jgi:hypothetical protein
MTDRSLCSLPARPRQKRKKISRANDRFIFIVEVLTFAELKHTVIARFRTVCGYLRA